MRIEYLEDNPSHIPLVASWQQIEFGYLNPALGLEERTEKLRQSLVSPERLPIVFLALSDDGVPLGVASIQASTLTHKHLTPWLSTVVVPPEHRNKGIASALAVRALLEAETMRYEALYLFTPRNESLYVRLGWKTFETSEHRGVKLAIMARSIGAPNTHRPQKIASRGSEEVLMKAFNPFAALRQHGMRAAIAVAIILASHWFRYRQLDWKDILFATTVFIVYVVLASWLGLRKAITVYAQSHAVGNRDA